MGITNFDLEILDKVIDEYKPKSVIELGDQQTYVMGEHYGHHANWYYESKGITNYKCIDLNGNNNCLVWDLSKPQENTEHFDLVTNFGTVEHIGDNGQFSLEASYNCFKTMHDLLNIGGIVINENPKTGHWEKHGFIFMTQDFYLEFAKVAGYEIIHIGEVGAMGNWQTGMNVFCVLKKNSEKFPTLEQFKKLPLKQK
jgi:hypothetical protein